MLWSCNKFPNYTLWPRASLFFPVPLEHCLYVVREVLSLDLTPQVLTTCQVGSHKMHWFLRQHTSSRSYCSTFVLKNARAWIGHANTCLRRARCIAKQNLRPIWTVFQVGLRINALSRALSVSVRYLQYTVYAPQVIEGKRPLVTCYLTKVGRAVSTLCSSNIYVHLNF